MPDDARQLIAQHAKTAQLLGVDFLPLGTPPKGLGAPLTQEDVTGAAQQPDPSPNFAVASPAQPSAQPSSLAAIEPIDRSELRACTGELPDQQSKLDALAAKYEHEAPHQHFNTTFTNIVFGEGNPNAELMFIGEAPGEQEDLSGRPFTGRAGQLLEKMIHAMGQSRETVYITNVLKTRPPGNATPTIEEARLCQPYLIEQIRIISPRVIVALGLPASHLLLGTTSPLRSLRGRWHPFAGSGEDFAQIQIMPTYHPAYLLRSYTQENRQRVWSDLTMVMEKLAQMPDP